METSGICEFCRGSGKHPYPPWCLLDWPCPACKGRGHTADRETPRLPPYRTQEEWRRAYERAAAGLVLMAGEFEPGTPLTPRCEAELEDGDHCNKGRGHDLPCGRIDLR